MIKFLVKENNVEESVIDKWNYEVSCLELTTEGRRIFLSQKYLFNNQFSQEEDQTLKQTANQTKPTTRLIKIQA